MVNAQNLVQTLIAFLYPSVYEIQIGWSIPKNVQSRGEAVSRKNIVGIKKTKEVAFHPA
jgi:hypothetical protein